MCTGISLTDLGLGETQTLKDRGEGPRFERQEESPSSSVEEVVLLELREFGSGTFRSLGLGRFGAEVRWWTREGLEEDVISKTTKGYTAREKGEKWNLYIREGRQNNLETFQVVDGKGGWVTGVFVYTNLMRTLWSTTGRTEERRTFLRCSHLHLDEDSLR